MSDLKYVCGQTAPGNERNPEGWAAEAWYSIDGDTVTLRDASGQSFDLQYKHKLEPGENPRAVAARLSRNKALQAPERHRGPIIYSLDGSIA